MKTILKAVRVPDFDMVGDEHYGDRPYGVCLDVYDTDDNFIENGTDWTYFANETEAEDYCRVFNEMNGGKIKVRILQRSVYYKTAELEIDIYKNDFQHYLKYNAPKGANAEDYISDYLIDNEDLWVDDIDHKINESEFIFGLGMDSGKWTDTDQESEWRYECDELKIGGHL